MADNQEEPETIIAALYRIEKARIRREEEQSVVDDLRSYYVTATFLAGFEAQCLGYQAIQPDLSKLSSDLPVTATTVTALLVCGVLFAVYGAYNALLSTKALTSWSDSDAQNQESESARAKKFSRAKFVPGIMIYLSLLCALFGVMTYIGATQPKNTTIATVIINVVCVLAGWWHIYRL